MVDSTFLQFQKPVYYLSSSALDRFYYPRKPWNSPVQQLAYQGSLAELSREVETLEFPGLQGVDAQTRIGTTIYQFMVLDFEPIDYSLTPNTLLPFKLIYDPDRDAFIDHFNIYTHLRGTSIFGPNGWAEIESLTPEQWFDLAIFISRYPVDPSIDQEIREIAKKEKEFWNLLEKAKQFTSLSLILTGSHSSRGIQLLHKAGAFEALWPFLSTMDQTSHSKECHPEGNVWEHSLECLRQRKEFDLAFSYALFLHDCGKPYANKNKNRAFDGHADIGAELSRRFLEELGCSRTLLEEISWLVESHMIPGALSILPRYRWEPYMANPWFPKLLELYRCDLASTWRKMEDYHHACSMFRGFLRFSNNPYRQSDGSKIT
jgi:poly(A) polymerase